MQKNSNLTMNTPTVSPAAWEMLISAKKELYDIQSLIRLCVQAINNQSQWNDERFLISKEEFENLMPVFETIYDKTEKALNNIEFIPDID